jgi:hypothetical protein
MVRECTNPACVGRNTAERWKYPFPTYIYHGLPGM